jgi:hypothetical protein
VADGVEHERDSGQRLHRPVVQEESDSSPLVLLRRNELLEEALAVALLLPSLAAPALDERVSQ